MDESKVSPELNENNRFRENPSEAVNRFKIEHLSSEEVQSIQEKALEVLRREFPTTENPGRNVSRENDLRDGGDKKDTGPRERAYSVESQAIPSRMLNEFVY